MSESNASINLLLNSCVLCSRLAPPQIHHLIFRYFMLAQYRFRLASSLLLMLFALIVSVNAINAQQKRWSKSVEAQLDKIPFDGRASYAYLEKICELGPRITGSKAMVAQREFLAQHFEKLGGKVSLQEFRMRHPITGDDVKAANLIVEWHPERKQRILLCTHFDTRPYPDKDKKNPRGLFLGANDGGSGTALLCELGKHMPAFEGKVKDGKIGIDFVFFDAEELVVDKVGDYFAGSTHFAKEYVANPPAYKYSYGVLLDMIGDANLNIYFEKHSLTHADKLTRSIFYTARKLRVREFIPRLKHTVNDDHLPINQIAKIPTCDIIDFDFHAPGGRYSYWHTTHDTVDKCSPLSFAKVGWVIHQWLQDLH